ncbi:MAG: phosphoribosylanthranilate isomerase [Betaproteobacteria bacterium]|nr:phosphoribosylanthranilate isomerase [Betaproteobacteria bacterium]
MPTRVKICGITRPEDGASAARLGADAIGLVFYERSPRAVSRAQAAEILASLPPFVTVVGLFVNPSQAEVDVTLDCVRLDLLQFHGDEEPSFCGRFGVPYLKAVRVQPGVDLLDYSARYRDAKGLLLDAFVEGVPGGTGHAFDWRLIPPGLRQAVVLSGGLSAHNVREAIRAVAPWAVDVSSGVESAKGIKDPDKMAEFMQGVRDAEV